MKSIIISSIALCLCFAFVAGSAIATGKILDNLIASTEEAVSSEDYEKIINDFRRSEKFLFLTLQDSTLFEIEYSLFEVKDFLSHGTEDEASAAKSRLLSKMEEPRRLSGFNIKSVF